MRNRKRGRLAEEKRAFEDACESSGAAERKNRLRDDCPRRIFLKAVWHG